MSGVVLTTHRLWDSLLYATATRLGGTGVLGVGVVELVDTSDLKSAVRNGREGSSPSAPTISADAHLDAGWSSLVARWAHNPKVAGSNPSPATI